MIGRNRDQGESAAVVFPAFEQAIESVDENEPRFITGQVHDDQSVWHLKGLAGDAASLSSRDNNNIIIGVFLPDVSSDSEIENKPDYGSGQGVGSLEGPHLVVYPTPDADSPINAHLTDASTGGIDQLNVELVEMDRLFIRVENDGRTPLGELRNKKVAFVGVGSGGGLVASYLAKAGVEELVFIDDDIYETHNIVRHVCGMDALGRKKVYALKDYIHERLPGVDIETYDQKFDLQTEDDKDFFSEVFSDVDMIIAASAEQTVNFQLDSFVLSELERDIPVIYAGMYENLSGGIMIRVDPDEDDPCYHCIYHKQGRRGGRDAAEARRKEGESGLEAPAALGSSTSTEAPQPGAADADVPYDRDQEDAASEPGLGLDVDNLSIFVTKMVLSNILKDTDHGLFEMPQNIYVWANRDMRQGSLNPADPDILLNGLELTYPTEDQIPRREDCHLCGD